MEWTQEQTLRQSKFSAFPPVLQQDIYKIAGVKWGPRGKRRQSREGLNTGSNKESSFKAKIQAKVPNNVYLE